MNNSLNTSGDPGDREMCRSCGQAASFRDTGIPGNDGARLVECSRCGAVLVSQKFDPQAVTNIYNSLFESGPYQAYFREFERFQSGKKIRIPYRTWLLRSIERTVAGRRMVEIGGASGAFGVGAVSRGWNYIGYDISEIAVNLSNQLGLDARLFEVDMVPPLSQQSVDCVVMWEVIEHVWNVHEYLLKICKSLTEGGALLLSTPNFEQRGYRESLAKPGLGSPPIHINFYTTASLQHTLQAAGFTSIRVFVRKTYFPKPSVANILKYVRMFLGFEPGKTLYAIACK